jgi:hypothetical protein
MIKLSTASMKLMNMISGMPLWLITEYMINCNLRKEKKENCYNISIR